MICEWVKLNVRPVNVSDLLEWIDFEEIGCIEHSAAVRKAVDQWVARSENFDFGVSVTRDELIVALCDGGIDDVENLVRERLRQAALMGTVWGGITAFQRLADPRVQSHEITAEQEPQK